MSEIERKFLLKSSSIVELLKTEGMKMEENSIIQIYTKITPDYEERLRKIEQDYIKTIKKGKGLAREEKEENSNKEEFEQALKCHIGEVVEKKRFAFKMGNLPCVIDQYEKELSGLVVFEIEFPSIEIAKIFLLPTVFQKFVIKEVTNNEAYKNKSIALFGNPEALTSYDMEEVFKRYDKSSESVDLATSLIPFANSFDAMRLIFYSLLKKIIQHKENFLQTSDVKELHNFRTNIRKSRSLLQTVRGVFDEHIRLRFAENLKKIANLTNSKRDLDVFIEYLELSDDEEAELLLNIISKKQENEEKNIKELLSENDIEQILQEWRVVLREENGFFKGESSHLHIKIVAAKSLRRAIKKIIEKLACLNETIPTDVFHEARIEFKKLRYLLEYFIIFFNDKKLVSMIKLSKKMQDYFGVLQDRDVQKAMLENIEKDENIMQDVEKVRAVEVLKESVKNDIYFYRTKILKKKEKLISKLQQSSKSLKVYTGFEKEG